MEWISSGGAMGIYVCLFTALYFEVFLLISFFEKKPEQKSAGAPRRYPTVTMVVPCFNEEKTLGHTINSLLALTYPKDKLDIYIVDDGSQDRTGEIGAALARKHARVTYHRKENGGKYTALNYGIEHSRGELIGCLDADSFVAPDALLEVIKKIESEPNTMAITPAMKVYRPRKLLELMQTVEYTFGVFYKKMFDNLAAVNVLPGPFSIYKREVFTKIGLFKHAHNTEDMEIAFRMHAHGLKIVNAHNAFVYTTVPSSLRGLIKQRTRWSQGFLQNSQDYSYMYFNPRFGNFGMMVLPFGLIAFFAGLYAALYVLINTGNTIVRNILDLSATGIPLHVEEPQLTWYYLNTSMMTFLIIATLCMTLVSVLLGKRISNSEIGIKSLLSYFLCFGLIAPVWLARATWGTMRARESSWR